MLDAPCSGSGTLSSKNPGLEKTFTKQLIDKSKKAQIKLLKKAIDVLKPGKEWYILLVLFYKKKMKI